MTKRSPLDLPFNSDNPYGRSLSGPRLDARPSSFLNMVGRTSHAFFEPNALPPGPYVATVLKIVNELDTQASPGSDQEPPKLVRVKARISHVHAALEPPADFEDHLNIDMHDTFVAASDDLPEPTVGEKIWVDFSGNNNEKPVYLRPVANSKHILVKPGPPSSRSFFDTNEASSVILSNSDSSLPDTGHYPGSAQRVIQRGHDLGPRTWTVNPGVKGEVCSDQVWEEWLRAVELLTNCENSGLRGSVYCPGRGKFDETTQSMMISHLNEKYKYIGFHCSSFTNFIGGWLYRVGANYTPLGTVYEQGKHVFLREGTYKKKGKPKITCYGPHPYRILPTNKVGKWGHQWSWSTDEIYARRKELPTFTMVEQSYFQKHRWEKVLNRHQKILEKRPNAKLPTGYWLAHNYKHCGIFVVDHRSPGTPLYRIAADGGKNKGAFNHKRMQYVHYTKEVAEAKAVRGKKGSYYRLYGLAGLNSPEILSRPFYPITADGPVVR